MTKASFLLSCLLLASNTAMAGSSPPPPPSNPPHDTGATQSQPIRRAEPSVARAATSTRHVSLDRAVAAPRRFVLEPAGEEQVLHVLQAHVDSQTETRDGVIIAPPQQIGFGRDVLALESPFKTRAQLDWQVQPDGGHAAALAIVSPDALALRLGLRIFKLPAEARVRVHAPDETTAIVFTGEEITALIALNLAAGDLSENARTWWSPTVEGNETVLEILLPPGIDPATVEVALPRISHLFASASTDWKVEKSVAEKLRELDAATCTNHLNVSCYSNWGDVGKATVKMLYDFNGGYVSLCTGTLLNDTDTSSEIPYLLTARHCISTQTSASTLETHWFYRDSCGSNDAASNRRTLMGGAKLLYSSSGSTADNTDTDTTFLRLFGTPPTGAVYAGWDATSLPTVGQDLVGIHHPGGDPQKISFSKLVHYSDCRPGTGNTFGCYTVGADLSNHISVDWNDGKGVVEGGSSGSGIFDANKKLLGTLHGSSGGCYDKVSEYGRFDLPYDRGISSYLNNADGTWTLSVSPSGDGSGRVYRVSGGIDCGSTCSAEYADNTTVTLIASADSGSSFTGWSGACTGTGFCTVTLNSDLQVTANFVANALLPYTLTVADDSSTGSGTVTSGGTEIDCAISNSYTIGTCDHDYPEDTEVTLTATADGSSHFAGWGGACASAGTTSTCIVTMSAAQQVTARFEDAPYTLTVTPSGNGTGQVTGDGIACGHGPLSSIMKTCTRRYAANAQVSLSAVPATDSVFTGWGDACAGTMSTTCTFTITGDSNVTANFDVNPATHTLTVTKDSNSTGTGGVRGTSGGNLLFECDDITSCTLLYPYPEGTVVVLQAIPDSNSHFVSWSGACVGNDMTCTFTLNNTANVVVARFDENPPEPTTYTLTVNTYGNGDGVVQGYVPPNGSTDIDCGWGSFNSHTTCSHTYPIGTQVVFSAYTDGGSALSSWGGDCSSVAVTDQCTITMDAAKTVTATFTPTYELTVTHAGTGSGTVTCNGSTCSPTYSVGTTLTLAASPNTGSTFAGWSGAECSGTGTCALTMDAAKTVTATFNATPQQPPSTPSTPSTPQPVAHTLTVNRLGSGAGKVSGPDIDCGKTCSARYFGGGSVTLTATPEAGSYFSGWGGACAGISPTCVFDMSSNQSVTARFDVGTAPWSVDMGLRDAVYAYKQPISGIAAQAKTFAAYNCDVFQILIDVESGFVDLSISEGATANDAHTTYPDRLHDTAAMFSYTLYSPAHVKSFSLSRYLDDASSSAPVGTATVFGYCFSTRTDAVVLLHDPSTGLCHRNDGSAVSCPTIPRTLSYPLPGNQ